MSVTDLSRFQVSEESDAKESAAEDMPPLEPPGFEGEFEVVDEGTAHLARLRSRFRTTSTTQVVDSGMNARFKKKVQDERVKKVQE